MPEESPSLSCFKSHQSVSMEIKSRRYNLPDLVVLTLVLTTKILSKKHAFCKRATDQPFVSKSLSRAIQNADDHVTVNPK